MTGEKKSGKQATKGQKQIVEENAGTLAFYRNMSLSSLGICVLVYYFTWSNVTTLDIVLVCLASLVNFGGHRFMAYMATPKYSETGQLVDGGIDLNMESGIAEHIKDLIILTSAIEALAMISRYFWLLWLIVPGYLAYMGWVHILAPWIFQPAPEGGENEKKQRKMERRMRRQQR
nr:EOG090X0IGL [Cyclestheria hislopi]